MIFINDRAHRTPYHVSQDAKAAGAIPNAVIASLRPRSIAVNEIVNFMEAPREAPTKAMTEWVESIQNV